MIDINRINFLARKSKTEGLTDEEKKEQAELRRAYIDSVKADLVAQLNNTKIVRPDGTEEAVRDRKKIDGEQ